MDGLPPKFLRDGANSICRYVTYLINLSINTCIVQADFKCAKVIPWFKKTCKFDTGNYRPVSILCVMSKVLENVAYKQLKEYLNCQYPYL